MSPITQCPACGAGIILETRSCPACGQPIQPCASTPPPIPQPPPLPVVPPFKSVTPPTPPLLHPIPDAGKVESGSSTPPPVMPPAIQASERVISVIGMVTRKTGVFSSELYHMVITDKRLIFALQTREDQSTDVKKAREKAKQEGRNLLGQIGAQMSTRSGEKYLGATPDLVLAENPKNFAFNLDEIIKIDVYHGDFEDNTPDSLEIKTTTQKLKFTISNAFSVEKQLKQVLGSKVR